MRPLAAAAMALFSSPAWAQSVCPPPDLNPVVNPTRAQWQESSDHDRVTDYELDILDATTGAVIQTLSLGLGVPDPNNPGAREEAINVQPIAFGTYCAVLRAAAGTALSGDSDPSNTWVRRPGRPSGAAIR